MILNRTVLAILLASSLAAGSRPSPIGTWRGESKCMTDAPACHDEQVVYFIEAVPHNSDQVSIRADKIVDGRSITMGAGPWDFDQKQQTLSFESAGRLWLLSISGNRIEGTLTTADGVLFRSMTLTRDRPESMRFR